jgi:hypothetical protein
METIKLKLSIEDINSILEGLGNLPYAKVFNVVATIQQQASEQIKNAEDISDAVGQTEANHMQETAISEVEPIPVTKQTTSVGK